MRNDKLKMVSVNLQLRNCVVANRNYDKDKYDLDEPETHRFLILKPKDNPHEVNERLAVNLVSQGLAEYDG